VSVLKEVRGHSSRIRRMRKCRLCNFKTLHSKRLERFLRTVFGWPIWLWLSERVTTCTCTWAFVQTVNAMSFESRTHKSFLDHLFDWFFEF
jgi:hypothetical protein